MKRFPFLSLLPVVLLSFGSVSQAEVIRVSREVPSFTKINMSLAGNIEVRRGSACKLEIEADREVLTRIETEVNGGSLNIDQTDNKTMNNPGKIRYFITMTNLSAIHLSGAGNIIIVDNFETPSLKLDLDGAGDISGSFSAGNVKVALSGTGTVTLKGSADNLKAELSGVGSLEAAGMPSKLVKVELSGVGTAEVHPLDALDAEVSGTGSVRYKGTPTTIRKEVSGMGSVKKL